VTSLLVPLLLLLVTAPLAIALLRANELFCLEVHKGEVRILRGRLPQRLLDDVVDVMRRAAPEHARIRGVVEGGSPAIRVDHDGGQVSDAVRQRLRNVLSGWPLAKIRNAPRPR
jgi:hypothetical protein